jgi:hypothetical protein
MGIAPRQSQRLFDTNPPRGSTSSPPPSPRSAAA